jgi:hypothetical protein
MRRLALWLALLLGSALVVTALIPRDPDASRPWVAPATSYSPGPEGAKAFYLLLAELGLDVQRSRRPAYTTLPAHSVLWVFGHERLGRLDRHELIRFVKGGGTLVAPPRAVAPLLELIDRGPCRSGPVERGPGAPSIDGLTLELSVALTAVMGCAAPDQVRTQLAGAALVAEWNVGQGRVVSLGLDEIVRNEHIGRAQNGIFLARLALDLGTEHVFDEHTTGFGEGSFTELLARVPYRWGLAQLAGVGAVLIWALARRRWPAEPPAPIQRRRTLDHVDAVARLWQQAGDAGLPLQAVLKRLDERARPSAGQAPGSPFLARIGRMHPNLGARAQEVWQNAQRLSREPRPSPEAVRRAMIDLESLEWEISKPWVKRPAT